MTNAKRIYTIQIVGVCGKIFESDSFAEGGLVALSVKAQKAIKHLNKDEKIGVLVYREDFLPSGDEEFGLVGDGNIINEYSHIREDMSNWVSVFETRRYLRDLLEEIRAVMTGKNNKGESVTMDARFALVQEKTITYGTSCHLQVNIKRMTINGEAKDLSKTQRFLVDVRGSGSYDLKALVTDWLKSRYRVESVTFR